MNPKNIAIVGLGHWGPNFARIVHEHDLANLSWCCDLREERIGMIKKFYPYVKTTNDINNMLKDDQIDAVIIAVPAAAHFEVAKKILNTGRDILIEKPLTASVKHALNLANLAVRKGRTIMVDHTFIFNPAIQKIKNLLRSGKVGKIHYGYGDYTALGPIRNDVSALWDLAAHFLYTITYLLDKVPTAITAAGRAFLNPKIDDVTFITLEFDDNTLFNLRVSWADPVKTRTFVLVGDKKMVAFDDNQSDGKVKLFDRGVDRNNDSSFLRHFFTLRYGDITIPHISNREPLREAFDEFMRVINRPTGNHLVSMQDGVNLVTLLEAAQKSLKHASKKIKLKYNKKSGLLSL